MELSQIIPHIEALIFASDKPLTKLDLVEMLNNAMGFIDDRATLDQVEAAVTGINEKYSAEFYAFELKQSGGGWQFLTKKEYHKTVAQLNGDKFLKRLSNAALETLAIIAYKQPITKSEIEAIRGVNCDYAVQKLLEKDLVIIAGRNEDAVGKPLIYTTSKSFMDYFGINSTADLPKISEVMMEELVKATVVNDGVQQEGETEEPGAPAITTLAVTENGEIVENDPFTIAVETESDESGTPGTPATIVVNDEKATAIDDSKQVIVQGNPDDPASNLSNDKKMAGIKRDKDQEEQSES
ncbi:MAG: SMC-Scp complex subunit ScpB [Ferruginibacter sp.]